ncbi:MAG: HNH endonuclease [Actinobacteria bacterium]|nr:HNH endonuclease [Actinomycetota bacterium]
MNPTKGYIALTDPEWYTYLSAQPRPDEVNFWQPRGDHTFRAISPGETFFFKLRAPHRAIAGFGFFQRYESMPASYAWDCFGEANGAPDFPSMLARITRLRRGGSSASGSAGGVNAGDFRIGCIMIAAPVFFTPDEWVRPPADWSPSGIQVGKRYDLSSGEGSRILRECMDRATRGLHYWNIEADPRLVAENFTRYGAAVQVRPRLGQGLFSLAVRDAYHGACAVTREHSLPALEAAHIQPYVQGGQHRVDNGLLLRSDLHRLYDRGYVTVTPDYVFRVGDSLRDDFKNGRSYYGLDGAKIPVPDQHL